MSRGGSNTIFEAKPVGLRLRLASGLGVRTVVAVTSDNAF